MVTHIMWHWKHQKVSRENLSYPYLSLAPNARPPCSQSLCNQLTSPYVPLHRSALTHTSTDPHDSHAHTDPETVPSKLP